MYQLMPIDSDITPPGLSPYGYERLKCGTSMVGKDWREEYSSTHRLVDLKKKLLFWIAPTRSWDPFLLSCKRDDSSINSYRGLSLLVIATGDVHLDVSERADHFLKALYDRRDKTLTAFSVRIKHQLIIECLSLCLGDMTANRIKAVSGCGDLKAMRRMISEKSALSVLNFLSLRLLEESQSSSFFSSQSSLGYHHEPLIVLMSTLIQCVCSNYLQQSVGKSYTTFSQFQLKTTPSASAHALKMLCTQLSNLYDEEMKKGHGALVFQIPSLLSKSLGIAIDHISFASTSYSGDTSKVIGIESRDGCYGVICTICRSTALLDNPSIIFESTSRLSEESTMPLDMRTSQTLSSATSLNFSLVHTLFGCVTFEDNALRLRSAASLDAVLLASVKAFKLVEALNVDAPKPKRDSLLSA